MKHVKLIKDKRFRFPKNSQLKTDTVEFIRSKILLSDKFLDNIRYIKLIIRVINL